MKLGMPDSIPSRQKFILELMEVIFFNNKDKTGYSYANDSKKMASSLDLGEGQDFVISQDHNILSFLLLMNHYNVLLKNEIDDLVVIGGFLKRYSNTLESTFYGDSNIRLWMRTENGSFTKSFEIALFYSYLFLNMQDRKKERYAYFKRLLSYLGVSSIDSFYDPVLSTFDIERTEGEDLFSGYKVPCLADISVKIFMLAMLTICCIIGRKKEKQEKYIQVFQTEYKSILQEYIDVYEGIEFADKTLFESVNRFDPRTIHSSEPDKMKIENFYVPVQFYRNGYRIEHPLSDLDSCAHSKRRIIQAKTGMGKSIYLQTMVLGMLKDKYMSESDERLNKLFKSMTPPQDMLVISVPASMFSYCYQKKEYQKWTSNFIDLYYNVMWKLSGGYNFFSNRAVQGLGNHKGFSPKDAAKTFEMLYDYLKRLALQGKLILVLDSFDEIYSGKMRQAYIEAINSFYKEYCDYFEESEIGAHVIISTREMSPKTMADLKNVLKIDDTGIFTIDSFDETRQKELVRNWIYFLKHDDRDNKFKQIWKQIQDNHYYKKYADNPYTLSVLCNESGKGLVNITKSFVDTLINEMNYNHAHCPDLLVSTMIYNMKTILQKIALELVKSGTSYFSNITLNQRLREYIPATGYNEEDISQAIKQVNEIIVTDVGLIVPADGRDDDYQFINDLIRYELAVEGVIEELGTDIAVRILKEEILPENISVDDFVGVMVPLICHLRDNYQLSEKLVYNLAMRDFSNNEENIILTDAVKNLILSKYASSVVDENNPPSTLASLVYRLQRIALMRLFTSAAFNPDDNQLQEIKNSAAYNNNKDKIKQY